MKNLIVYYLLIFVPLFLLIDLTKNNLLTSGQFVGLLFFYAFIYRTLTDYYRLKSKNIIDKKGFWKIFVPGSRLKYFRDLYFI